MFFLIFLDFFCPQSPILVPKGPPLVPKGPQNDPLGVHRACGFNGGGSQARKRTIFESFLGAFWCLLGGFWVYFGVYWQQHGNIIFWILLHTIWIFNMFFCRFEVKVALLFSIICYFLGHSLYITHVFLRYFRSYSSGIPEVFPIYSSGIPYVFLRYSLDIP